MSVAKVANLLNEARLLLEVRKYRLDEQCTNESSIDLVASEPDKGKTILIKIITKSDLSSDTISVKQVRALKTMLDDHNYDKIIVFGRKFTSAAEKELAKNEFEFFSGKRVFSTFDPQNLYTRILECVDEQCTNKCGFIPKLEHDCIGYSNSTQTCSHCDGNGNVSGSIDVYWQQKCPVCGG
ncbi:MAG: restriction endonuclease, partial [Candidatus Ranarchaeia archaeon]